MTLKEYIRNKVLHITGPGRIDTLPAQESRLTFVVNADIANIMKLREYNMWYEGDSDNLLAFYTKGMAFEYNFEPFFDRNKRNYFWAISSMEDGIKRTHSGQAKNIIDTLTSILGKPNIKVGDGNNDTHTLLYNIYDECDFWNDLYKETQVPMTMVEGYGCFKIVWDTDLSDYPFPVYYRAEDVDFIYKANKVVGIVFKDWYVTNTKKYLLTETRYIRHGNLYIENELFETTGGTTEQFLIKVGFDEVPELFEKPESYVIEGYNKLLAVPCVFYKDSSNLLPGRSLLSGKIDLLDDLDQALSQAANTVRKSTPVEYFDTNYLERDKHNIPIMPNSYDRKYVMVKGAVDAEGTEMGKTPVMVTQPNLNFQEYDTECTSILLQIMNGIISPATLGMDVAKKDNADAQREKEKVTIFTRNNIADCEKKILKDLSNQLLNAMQLMQHGEITIKNYDIQIDYPGFADDSFENKIAILGDQFAKGTISPDMFIEKLYGDDLSGEKKDNEIEYLRSHNEDQEQEGFTPGMDDMSPIQGKEQEQIMDEEGIKEVLE